MPIDTPHADVGVADDARLILDLLPTMVWMATADGRLEFVSQQLCAFTGESRERLLATNMTSCVHPLDHATQERLRVQLRTGEAFDNEFRMRRHDGEYIRCVSRAVPVRDSAGRLIRWLGTVTDIEELLSQSDRRKLHEEHLELGLDSADVGIWRLELPSYTLTVDERTRRHLDLDRHVIHNYNPADLIHPQDFARSSMQEEDAHGLRATEHRVRHRDGTYRWQAIRWRRWYLGNGENEVPALITGTSIDVTARKEAEAEREELRQRYQIALEAAGLGTWSYDIEHGVLHPDDRARTHLGVDKRELTFEESIACVLEQDRERALYELRRQVRDPAQRNRAHLEYRVRHANGETRWLSLDLQVIYCPDTGKPLRTIGVTRDITENKQAVEKVRMLNAELERRVQQRTAELTAANEELESFAYTVSHDLRAPLRAMWGFCEALIEDYAPALPAEAHGYLRHVIDGSRHLAETIEGLLTLSRSTRGSLRRDLTDLSSIAEKVLSEFARVDPERCVSWTVEPGLRAYGDSRMIDVVMRNLLGNAWKYTAHRPAAVIRVYSEQIEGETMFCIADNGAGFSMEHADRLFKPFQRLHRQDEFSGLGIGLATVQRIIHRHGGTVSGEGAPDGGAVFRFSLPSAPEPVTGARREGKNHDHENDAIG